MKYTKYLLGLLFVTFLLVSCDDDDNGGVMITAPSADAGSNQTLDIEERVILDGSASTGESLTYEWNVIDPDGNMVSLTNSSTIMIEFVAHKVGIYKAALTVTNEGGTEDSSVEINVENPTYVIADQMGRPAINTVFNFFGNAETKNGYNYTTPENGNAEPSAFEGILDALQTYIGLDSDNYTNVLGLDNTTTATVLATDVLMSNKSFSSTYGPSDLNNIVVGQNVLNGRKLQDDVVDVTLILTFAANDLSNLSSLQQGLISDFVNENDKTFLSTFPYLAAPH